MRPNARIVHVDIDPSEIGKNVAVDVPIVGDVGRVLRALTPPCASVDPDERADYFARARRVARATPRAPAGTARAPGATGCCRPTTSSRDWAS